MEFAQKTLCINKTKIKFQLWNSNSQTRFTHMSDIIYKYSHGAILIYDIFNRKSFEYIKKKSAELKNLFENMEICLIGNKLDLIENDEFDRFREVVEREVDETELQLFGIENNVCFNEVSAKTGYGIDKIIEEFLERIIEKNNFIFQSNSENKVIMNNTSNNYNHSCF